MVTMALDPTATRWPDPSELPSLHQVKWPRAEKLINNSSPQHLGL